MPWSNSNTPKAKSVLSRDLAAKTVLDFVPARFDLGTPEQAMEYIVEKKRGSDFRMNEAVRIQTGVDVVEQSSEEERVEAAALEKLKEIQEGAYTEAYKLGLEEGRKEAFQKVADDLAERMNTLDQLLLNIKGMKKEMLAFNESHLVKLAFEMASRLAKTELQGNNEAMIGILRDAVGLAQDEEDIRVRVATSQFDFLEELKKETGREFEFVKKIKFEPDASISEGGCIVETNYGEVDAQIEQRVNQLGTVLAESLPRVKNKVAS